MKNATVEHKDKVISYDDSFTNQYNVPVPKNNLLHVDSLKKSHGVWDTINNKDGTTKDEIQRKNDKNDMQDNFKKLNESSRGYKKKENLATCKKCGGSGHFAFECMNTFDLTKGKSVDPLNTLIASDDETDRKRDKMHKKERKEKKRKDKEEKKRTREEKDESNKKKK